LAGPQRRGNHCDIFAPPAAIELNYLLLVNLVLTKAVFVLQAYLVKKASMGRAYGSTRIRFLFWERFEEGSMYLRNKMRLLGMSALVGAGLVAATSASAYNVRLGDIDIQIDNTVSAGATWRVEDREDALLGAAQGGNPDLSPGLNLGMTGTDNSLMVPLLGASAAECGTLARVLASTDSCMFDTLDGVYNYDRGINGDDGRLNFDNGDITSGLLKLTTDFEASVGNLRAFVRTQAFYDAVLDSDSSFERTGLNEQAKRDAIENINVLDAYVDYNTSIVGAPVLIRAGRQVINWGESTFFIGGNSVFSPIDVPAIRRPGAEIKEALLPVEAIYASVSLPFDLSLEAYVGGWDHFKLDVGGTAEAGSDAANVGSNANGNKFLVGTGPFGGANKRNCDLAASANPFAASIGSTLDTLLGTCSEDDIVDYRTAIVTGNAETQRAQILSTNAVTGATLGDTNYMNRGADEYNDDFDDYGLAVRWYSEALNSTEFGLYYQNYTSRIPYVSSRAGAPIVGLGAIGPKDGAFTRQYGIAGCASQDWAALNIAKGETGYDAANDVVFEDPLGVAAATNAVAQGIWDTSKAAFEADNASKAGGIYAALANGNATRDMIASAPTTLGEIGVAGCVLALAQMGVSETLNDHLAGCRAAYADNNALAAALAAGTAQTSGCSPSATVLSAKTGLTGAVGSALNATGAGYYLPSGAFTAALRYQGDIFLEYPDDIEVYGLSFATTAFGWGVQGEVAYREAMPLQIDTDMVTISAIAGSCTWEQFTGVKGLLYGQQLTNTKCGNYDKYQGFVEEEVIHYDLGTTATFTRSNPLVNLLGADLAVLLTELQHVHAPGMDDYKFDYNGNKTDGFSNTEQLLLNVAMNRAPRLASRCTSGGDLPLGGILSIDPRGVDACRPTVDSSGALLFLQLQYNNVFGSAWSAKPQIVHSWGLDGMSPTPAASWIEDQSTTGVSVTFEKQGNLAVALGYSMKDGDILYNPNIDRDNVSLSVTYAY
jgi:hypothetical protein